MAHQFRAVERDAEMLLPPNMLDWVPDGHAVLVVIDAIEAVASRDLLNRLVPQTPARSARGPARYDPVMLLTVWTYAYLRGVLSSRAVEDRCRYDATFRVACGRYVPDHTTLARFRQHLLARDGLAEELFYRVLRVCACAGLGRLTVVAGDGVKIAANASKEATRTEAGLRKLAAKMVDGAQAAAAADAASQPPLPGTDLLLGAETAPDPNSRAGRVARCLAELTAEREAAESAAAETGKAYLQALRAGTLGRGRPPAGAELAAAQHRLDTLIAGQHAALATWQQHPAGRRPAEPGTGAAAGKARSRVAELQARAEAREQEKSKSAPRRNVTDPDSRLLSVRGGGYIQGYNVQDAAADDRLMLGGYATQDANDQHQSAGLDAITAKGAAVVAEAHASHAGDPAAVAACHRRMCTLPAARRDDPGHDAAACHHEMTSEVGVSVRDAGYHSAANLASSGADLIVAPGKTRDLPAGDAPPAEPEVFGPLTAVHANAARLATPEGRAAYKRRAPDVEGVHASVKDDGKLRRFSVRGLTSVNGEFLLAGIGHNLRLLTGLT